MGRPVDWQPLADSDPVPGSIQAIRDEATRLASMARTIQNQVRRLTAIGADTDKLKGQYADKLRSSAGDLAGKLDKAQGRYDKVSGYLPQWADELDGFQSQSVRVLDQAQDAQRRVNGNQPPAAAPNQPHHQPTPQEQSADAARRKALDTAQGDLQHAHDQLSTIIQQRDDRARYWKGQIESAVNDGVHDGFWDSFKDWVDRNSRWLSDLANVLGWIATACAILSLIPGLQFLAIVAAVLSGINLLIHLSLALAGDGSWVDVGLDLLALVTFGAGKIAGSGLKAVEEGTKGALEAGAEGFGKAAWRAAAKGDLAEELSSAGKLVNSTDAAEKAAGSARMSNAVKGLWAAKKGAVSDALDMAKSEMPKPTFLQAMRAGDADGAGLKLFSQQATARFPGESSIADAVAKGSTRLTVLQNAFRAGEGVDSLDKAFGATAPYLGWQHNPWTDFKDFATVQVVGAKW